MMILRNSLNDLGLSGFVKKSDQLLAVRTKGTVNSNFSTMSRTKKWRRSTCLVLLWCSGLWYYGFVVLRVAVPV